MSSRLLAGEPGLDAGGVAREFWTLLTKVRFVRPAPRVSQSHSLARALVAPLALVLSPPLAHIETRVRTSRSTHSPRLALLSRSLASRLPRRRGRSLPARSSASLLLPRFAGRATDDPTAARGVWRAQSLFDPNAGLFRYAATDNLTYQINPLAEARRDAVAHTDLARFTTKK